jgi:hypothetical protein
VIAHLIEAAYAEKGLLEPIKESINIGNMTNETMQAL